MSCSPARHPFRQSLPPHVLGELMVIPQPVLPGLEWARARRGGWSPALRWPLTGQDLRDFLMAYCACFMAFGAFLF